MRQTVRDLVLAGVGALMGVLILASLAGSDPTPAPGPPTPAPLAPCPPDGPCPPMPAPRPAPRPRPWGQEQAPVGALVNGPKHSDGTEIDCDLPGDMHKGNITSRGQGCCVFRSIHHAALWQDVPVLQGFPEWLKKKGLPGGGFPGNVKNRITAICKEKGVAEPAYIQVEGMDLEVLKSACKHGLMPSVTYSHSPTGRYGGKKISHMVNLAGASEKYFIILDNNYVGENAYEWLTPQEFRKAYAPGWAVILLNPGPPPVPRNIERESESERALIEQAVLPRPRSPRPRSPRPKLPAPTPRAPFPNTFGVDWEQIGKRQCYRLNGKEIGRQEACHLVGGAGQNLPPLANKARVVVIGPGRDQVVADFKSSGHLAPFKDEVLVQPYDANHWHIARVGFVNTGKPTIYVLTPQGVVLHRQDDYEGGAEALARGLSCLRRPGPYRPDKDPDGRKRPLVPLPLWWAGLKLPTVPGSALALGAAACALVIFLGRTKP